MMKKLIKRSYKAIKERGLITDETTNEEFRDKMNEELIECIFSDMGRHQPDYIAEVTDLATVCIMQIHHLGYDFETEFKKVVEKNEARAKS